MPKNWRDGYLIGLSNEGWRCETATKAFIAIQARPYHQHRTTGMEFYLALEEASQDRYTKQFFHRIWSVGVASDGSQSGECSSYTSLAQGEGYPSILERFDQYQRFAVSNCKRRYPQYQDAIATN